MNYRVIVNLSADWWIDWVENSLHCLIRIRGWSASALDSTVNGMLQGLDGLEGL